MTFDNLSAFAGAFTFKLFFFIHTCAEVSICKGLQDAVHGSHVEDEAQLSDTHGDEAEQEDGAEDTTHE